MSYQDRIVIIVLLSLLSGCESNDNSQDNTKKYYQISIKISSPIIYDGVWNLAKDTLDYWIKNKLTTTRAYRNSNWRLDSLICFNTAIDKCIMSVYHQEGHTTNNALDYFYGIKIRGKWYFFYGAVVYAFSEAYGYPKNTPLPFTKLHEIAMDNIFKGYLKKNKKSGEWEINEDYFARFYEKDAYNFPFTTQEEWEESWLKLMRENWEKRDTTNYKLLQ